jgi:CelD/BcsL family acetyltransferase involved in cellulose biosynthesis
MRKNFKDQKNKLKKTSSYNICHYTGDKAVASWDSFLSIEDSGWKGDRSSSIKRLPENYRSYYKNLIDLLNENNKLHMYFLIVNGQPIAGLFCYEDNGMFHAWKSGYIEEFYSLSPSNALMLFVIEDLIANFPTIKILNLFTGNYGYKARFAHEDSLYILTTLFNKTIYGRTAYILDNLKQRVKLYPGMSTLIKYIRNVK